MDRHSLSVGFETLTFCGTVKRPVHSTDSLLIKLVKYFVSMRIPWYPNNSQYRNKRVKISADVDASALYSGFKGPTKEVASDR